MLADDVKALIQLAFVQTDQDRDVACFEEAAGGRQFGDGKACFHQAGDNILRIIVIDDSQYHFHNSNPLFALLRGNISFAWMRCVIDGQQRLFHLLYCTIFHG